MTSTLTLPVEGMTCGGCENAVKRAVGTLPGVSDVAASHRDSKVVVTYDPSTVSPAEIETKIGKLGYRVAR